MVAIHASCLCNSVRGALHHRSLWWFLQTLQSLNLCTRVPRSLYISTAISSQFWFIKEVLKTGENIHEGRQSNEEVLKVLHGLFRQPDDNDNGTLYWESVLIGRRFVLLACRAFITNCRFSLSRNQKILKNKIETIQWQTLRISNVLKD